MGFAEVFSSILATENRLRRICKEFMEGEQALDAILRWFLLFLF